MPKTHSVTGCQVMTNAEFWVSEAENEGKGRSGADLAEDFWDDWGKEEERERDRLENPESAFEYLKEVVDSWIEYDPDFVEYDNFPVPTKVIKVLDVQFGASISGNKTTLRVLAKTERGAYVYDLWFQYWSGSMMDPPEEDGDISWIAAKCLIS